MEHTHAEHKHTEHPNAEHAHAVHKPASKLKILLVALLLVVAVALVSVLYITTPRTKTLENNWLSIILNYNNSRYQANATVNASNAAQLRQSWVIYTHNSVTSTPVILNGNVFFSDFGGYVYSANLLNGTLNWKINLGAAISSTPTLYNGLIYIDFGPLGATNVTALSQADGHVVWNKKLSTTMNSIWASPIIYNGLLYTGVASAGLNAAEDNASQIGEIFALDAKNGTVAWSFNTMIGANGGAGIWGSVAVDPKLNAIYFGTGNPYLTKGNGLYGYAIMSLNATKGTLNWFYQAYNSVPVGHDLDFGSTPNLFAMTANNTIYEALGLGNKDGDYYILNRVNGVLLDKFPVGVKGNLGLGIIGLAGFTYTSNPNEPELFIPSYNNKNKTVCCGVVEALFPSNGSAAWRFNTVGMIEGSVAIAPGAIFFGDTKGNFYAVSIATGSQLFHVVLPSGAYGGVTISNNFVLVPTAFGSANSMGVYAFSLPEAAAHKP